jgi:uncharacterized membrane protein YeaQ/YmgE (transglycosylase-associated protein family)
MKRYLIFGALGPFIGGLLLLFTTSYLSGYWTQTNLMEIGKFFVVLFKSLQYSYLFGILPALMIAAVDDIVCHVPKVGPLLRMLIVGAIAFLAAAFMYAGRGPDSGAVQFILYGLVGLVPGMLSSWLSHKVYERPAKPATNAA